MTRLTMPSAMSAETAEVLSDNERPYDAFEEAWIAHRTQELLTERLNDASLFRDLLSGIDALEIEPQLHRALMNLDRAIQGEIAGEAAVFSALSLIQRRVRLEAGIVWRDECRDEAERQLKEEL